MKTTTEEIQRRNLEKRALIQRLEKQIQDLTSEDLGDDDSELLILLKDAKQELCLLRQKTEAEFSFTFEPTKERISLYAPFARNFQVIAENPDILKVFTQQGMKDCTEILTFDD